MPDYEDHPDFYAGYKIGRKAGVLNYEYIQEFGERDRANPREVAQGAAYSGDGQSEEWQEGYAAGFAEGQLYGEE